jgi:hypothetical protein
MKLISIIAFCLLFCNEIKAQVLPWGWCGIVNVYDAAGNRTKRVYFCQNGDPYPQRPGSGTAEPEQPKKITEAFQPVDKLYPNPTSGKVFVTFSRELNNAILSIHDNTGKLLSTFKAKGMQVEFDLSPFPAGMYYIRIEENGKVINKKVIKL